MRSALLNEYESSNPTRTRNPESSGLPPDLILLQRLHQQYSTLLWPRSKGFQISTVLGMVAHKCVPYIASVVMYVCSNSGLGIQGIGSNATVIGPDVRSCQV